MQAATNWTTPTLAANSFNDIATNTAATVEISTSTLTLSEPPSVSGWWGALVIPAVVAVGWLTPKIRRRAPGRSDDGPTGWAITRWMHNDQASARGWRLSRFEELPESDFTPLYGSLDDRDTAPIDNVVPLHHHPEWAAPKPRNAHSSRISTGDVIDVEARLLPGGH